MLHDVQDKLLSTLDVLNKTSLVNLCRYRDLPTAGTKETLQSLIRLDAEDTETLSPQKDRSFPPSESDNFTRSFTI